MEKPADCSELKQTIEKAIKSYRERDAVEDQGGKVCARAPLAKAKRTATASDDDTATLLRRLIAECRGLKRELAAAMADIAKVNEQRGARRTPGGATQESC
jgi:uncharacterized alpha-E superfamily protein